MKNLLKKATLRLNLTQERLSLIGLDIWEQTQAKKAQEEAWRANKDSGIKGTYIDEKGNVSFKL